MKLRFVLSLAFLLAAPPVLALPCADADEVEAHRVRALQTELMVAALSCGWQSDYNNFVRSFSPELKQNAAAFRAYYTRTHGAGGEAEMNRYVTKLANYYSKKSARGGVQDFCEQAEDLRRSVRRADSLTEVDYSFSSPVKACGSAGKKIIREAALIQKKVAEDTRTPPTPKSRPWYAFMAKLLPF